MGLTFVILGFVALYWTIRLAVAAGMKDAWKRRRE
jgi:hypothetical protein